jgi:hypothetical protein
VRFVYDVRSATYRPNFPTVTLAIFNLEYSRIVLFCPTATEELEMTTEARRGPRVVLIRNAHWARHRYSDQILA